ncbi:MAG: hypothetical protein H8E35_07450 [Ardenticatenia bacterium]|nr:hypothetical protein [Ardenticatenia bacterium]
MIINPAIADIHSGSTVSLCPPNLPEDDGGPDGAAVPPAQSAQGAAPTSRLRHRTA